MHEAVNQRQWAVVGLEGGHKPRHTGKNRKPWAESLPPILQARQRACRHLVCSRRFHAMEALARSRAVEFGSLSLDQQEALWVEVKIAERAKR